MARSSQSLRDAGTANAGSHHQHVKIRSFRLSLHCRSLRHPVRPPPRSFRWKKPCGGVRSRKGGFTLSFMTTPSSTTCLIYNPNCSKSRTALSLLKERGQQFEVRDYLQQPLSAEELWQLREQLDLPVRDWVRGANLELDEAGLIQALVGDPGLLQRPIVVHGQRAIVARPPILLTEFLDGSVEE